MSPLTAGELSEQSRWAPGLSAESSPAARHRKRLAVPLSSSRRGPDMLVLHLVAFGCTEDARQRTAGTNEPESEQSTDLP